MVSSLTVSLLEPDSVALLADFVARLKPHEQRKYLDSTIAFVVKQLLPPDSYHREDKPIPTTMQVSGVASLFYTLVKGNEVLKEHVVSNLTRSTIPSLNESLSARRSIMAALAQDKGEELPYQYDLRTN